ncbi:MAG: NAD(+) diphosphatase [Saccharospirillum sp.]|nr:NAD(+) diphosphatase [Saccharospirillum sp.]
MLYEVGQHRVDLPGLAPEPQAADRFLLWWQGDLAEHDDTVIWQRFELPEAVSDIEFVGLLNGHAYYTGLLKQAPESTQTLRALGIQSETAFMMAARARGLLDWRRQHKFCGQCGRPTQAMEGESAMVCQPCRLRFYPRVSPCIITLVTRGPEVLLAQGVHHRQSGWYSTLAGFIETGESAEQAVLREVREEVGVSVHNLRYQGSQAWPFPHQLMLGFWADYEQGDIVMADGEILDAQWFHIDRLPPGPPGFSIAGWMLRRYRDFLAEL